MATTSERFRRRVTTPLAVLFGLVQLFVPVMAPLYDIQLRAVHVALGIATLLLAVPAHRGRGSRALLGLDLLLIAAVVVANAFVFVEWEEIVTEAGGTTRADLVLGALLVVIVIEAARRAAGWAIPACVLLMLAYVFAGPYMPGIWRHPGFPLSHLIETLYRSGSGIYGSLTGTSATYIAMFILFGALLQATGGGRTFMDLALWLAGRFKGGPAKVGVVASALFGMISGSAVANVAVTGNYTIPLMRRLGYDPDFAGGVEAMSSTGGGITPPVMGIAAFIMADFLGISYLAVIGYAAIPCLLFYTGVLAGVHFEAMRAGLAPVPAEELPRARDVFRWSRTLPLFVPVGVLFGLLLAGFSLLTAGYWACLSVAALYLFSDLSPGAVRARLRELVRALGEGGVAIATIVPILVAVAMFTALLGLTGVAPKVSAVILAFGGENLIVSLFIAALIPLLLGAPLPVAATYVLSAALIAPALTKLGLDVVAVHLFLLYWATFASVTPPTCTACVVAANISGGAWLRTSLIGMKLGIVAFVVPFFFATNPALIGRGATLDVVLCAASGLVGTIFIAGGFFGYLRHRLSGLSRLLYASGGMLLLAPSSSLLLAGGAAVAAGLASEHFLARRSVAAERS